MPRAIAITQGDSAGIGPETIVQAFLQQPELTQDCFVVGDLATMRRAAQVVCQDDVGVPFALISSVQQTWDCPPRCIPLWPIRASNDFVSPAPWGKSVPMRGSWPATAWFGLPRRLCVVKSRLW